MAPSVRKATSCPRLKTESKCNSCYCGQECLYSDNKACIYRLDNCARSDALAAISENELEKSSIKVAHPALSQNARLIRQDSKGAQHMSKERCQIGTTGWYVDNVEQTDLAMKLQIGGQSARHENIRQMRTLKSRSFEHLESIEEINSLCRGNLADVKQDSIPDQIFPASEDNQQQLVKEMTELKEMFRRSRDSFDESDDDSIDLAYEDPVGWKKGGRFRNSNCFGLYQLQSINEAFVSLGQMEQSTKALPSFVTAMQQDEILSISHETTRQSAEQEMNRKWILQDDYSRQREHIKVASAYASDLLVATPTRPTLSLRRLIQSPLFNRKTNKKAFPKGISSLDEPWDYERRSEEEEMRSISANSSSTTSSKWTQFTQKSKFIRPIIRQRAYTSHHISDTHPCLK